jgi:uncharacterized phiE125 gp8 family phage protein
MFVRVITPPAPVVSWAEARKHLRLDNDEDHEYVEGLIAAATDWIDGPAGWLGRAIGEQTLELVDCAFGYGRLPYPPLVSVESITYLGSDGVDHVLPADDYRQLPNGGIAPLLGAHWPSVATSSEAVRIVYVAGYPDRVVPPTEEGATATRVSTVPAPIKLAVKQLVAHWYLNREAASATKTEDIPFGVEAQLSPYRIWS